MKGHNKAVEAREEEKQDDWCVDWHSNFTGWDMELELDNATSTTDVKKDETES